MSHSERPQPSGASEYIFQNVTTYDAQVAERAQAAMNTIMDKYGLGEGAGGNRARRGSFATMLRVVGGYFRASLAAEEHELAGDLKEAYIKGQMRANHLIDTKDDEKFDADYEIISNAYDLNSLVWDRYLGRNKK